MITTYKSTFILEYFHIVIAGLNPEMKMLNLKLIHFIAVVISRSWPNGQMAKTESQLSIKGWRFGLGDLASLIKSRCIILRFRFKKQFIFSDDGNKNIKFIEQYKKYES